MAVRIVKQPHVIFHVEHVTRRVIQLRHRHFAGFDQPRQVLAVILVAHAHVNAGLERHAHRIFRIGGGAVFNQLFDGPVVRHGNAFKAPLIAQNVLQQPGIRGRWRAVQRVQRHHHRAAACIQTGFVRRHIVVKQALWTHVHGVVLFTALHGTVGGEVLHAGHHRIAIRRAFALHRFHHRFAHDGGQIGIFAKTFRGASPARIAGDIDHRCPGHIQAVVGGFIRRDASDGFHRVEVKRGRQPKANREDGTLAVQHVIGKKERDFQAAQFHHLILHFTDVLTGNGVKNRAHLAVFDHLADRFFRVIRADAYQTQLANLFIDGHFRQQLGDKRIPRFRRQRMITEQLLRQRWLQRQTDCDTYRT